MANTIAPPTEQRLRMSYEDFLEQFDESTHGEWVDGEVTIFMPPDPRHQDVVWFLGTLLRLFLRTRGLGQLIGAPIHMQLRSGRSYREPDLFVILNEHMDKIGKKRIEGPADVIIEVVSPESARRDHEEKLKEYEAAGVPEYWIVDGDTEKPLIDGYVLDGTGRYRAITPDPDGKLRSVIMPGFWFDPAWLPESPLPDERQLADEMVAALNAD